MSEQEPKVQGGHVFDKHKNCYGCGTSFAAYVLDDYTCDKPREALQTAGYPLGKPIDEARSTVGAGTPGQFGRGGY